MERKQSVSVCYSLLFTYITIIYQTYLSAVMILFCNHDIKYIFHQINLTYYAQYILHLHVYTGCPQKSGTVDFQDFVLFKQLFCSLFSIGHLLLSVEQHQ